MNSPKLVCPNLYQNPQTMRSFALDMGFEGIEWTLQPDDLPRTRVEQTLFLNMVSMLAPLEVRFHLFFREREVGHRDATKAASALGTYHCALKLISMTSSRFATVHVGLTNESFEYLSWNRTLRGCLNWDLQPRGLEYIYA